MGREDWLGSGWHQASGEEVPAREQMGLALHSPGDEGAQLVDAVALLR